MYKVDITVKGDDTDVLSLYVPDRMTEQDVLDTVKKICFTFIERSWVETSNIRERGEFTIYDFNKLIPEHLCEEFSVYRVDQVSERHLKLNPSNVLIKIPQDLNL